MRRCYTDLVDKKLCRLVGMNVVYPRSEADHLAAFERDDYVMARIAQELPHQARLQWIIENVCGYIFE